MELNSGGFWWYALLYAVGVVVALQIILENRNPIKTASYVLLILLVPPLGLVVFYLFGQSLRRRRYVKKRALRANRAWKRWEDSLIKDLTRREEQLLEQRGAWAPVARLVYRSRGGHLTTGNAVQLLENGEAFFASLKADMQRANHHIHLEFYIAEEGFLWSEMMETLVQKASSGVQVRVILDDVGSRGIPQASLRQLRCAGVEIHFFQRVFFPYLTSGANYRNHRKLAIIDSKVAYTGGLNLADRYVNSVPGGNRYWRDQGLRVEGNAVSALQAQFWLQWDEVCKEPLPALEPYFPPLENRGASIVQVAASGPDSDWASIMQATFKIIGDARRYVYLATPYFIPNEQILTALQTAALSGVEVKLMVPAKGDSWISQAATFSYLKPMVEAGVDVLLYEKGFLHSKTLVADDELAMVGTANLDYRSFDINWELNLLVYDPATAREQRASFERDLLVCSRLNLNRWNKRPRLKKWTESFARLLAPLL